MNVGILTMHRVRNWGSFLQAFALKQIVEGYGHKCSFIDIKPNTDVENPLIQRNSFNQKLSSIKRDSRQLVKSALKGNFVTTFNSMKRRYCFNKLYDNKFLPILGVGKELVYDGNYDLVIIGSDEVFNTLQPETHWYKSMQLFGEGINAKKIVTYAASFGYTKLEALKAVGLKGNISNALKNVSKISVRDLNSFEIIEDITGIAPELCVDPVFIYNYNNYLPENVPLKDYIIIYSYPGRIRDNKIISAIKECAKKYNKKCISLHGYYNWCDKSVIAKSPFELLRYFAAADSIVTDTFHGTIFSIKYNKKFVTLVRDSNSNKLNYLLNQMNLSDRIVSNPEDVILKMECPVDYSKTNNILETEVLNAKQYLKNILHFEI